MQDIMMIIIFGKGSVWLGYVWKKDKQMHACVQAHTHTHTHTHTHRPERIHQEPGGHRFTFSQYESTQRIVILVMDQLMSVDSLLRFFGPLIKDTAMINKFRFIF